jgi:hypothetical protein
MVWKGVGDDSGIYWTRDLGHGFEPQQRVPGVGTSAGPSLANLNGTIYMAWKGLPGDSGLYWSVYDQANNRWGGQSPPIAGDGTSDSPALVAFQGKLYLFWKGVVGDDTAWYSSYDPVVEQIWRPQRQVQYYSYQTDGGVPHAIGTTGALSACARSSDVLLAWKGAAGDSGIYVSLLANDEFSGQVRVANVGTAVGPCVAQLMGRTLMAWKGADSDSTIWWSQL